MIEYILHLADNALIIGHRNSEWCGHGPVLEQDIALTNISLDQIGQARNFYQYAALLQGNDATEDSLAYLRDARAFRNCLLLSSLMEIGDKLFFVNFYSVLFNMSITTNFKKAMIPSWQQSRRNQ